MTKRTRINIIILLKIDKININLVCFQVYHKDIHCSFNDILFWDLGLRRLPIQDLNINKVGNNI